MLKITTVVEKCDRLQDYNTQLETQMTPLQTQLAKLQKELQSSFKSFTVLKKKSDELQVALASAHGRLRSETSRHFDEVDQFRSIIYKLEEDLSCAQRDLVVARDTLMVEYKESKAF